MSRLPIVKKPSLPTLLPKAFADWLVQQYPQVSNVNQLQKLTEAVSLATQQKHSCLDMDIVSQLNEPQLTKLLQGITTTDIQLLANTAIKPLVFSKDGKVIWLSKYHYYESSIATRLCAMANVTNFVATNNKDIDAFFTSPINATDAEIQGVNDQKNAVIKALNNQFTVITGGPGTGKTHTVARLIALLAKSNPNVSIMLAAPTGKAAQRMKEALTAALMDKTFTGIKNIRLPEKAYTIDSLLGIKFNSVVARKNALNPIACDILIVDEASMIAAPMMHRLLNALKTDAKLVLLGDADQLASVEAGSILGDICQTTALHNNIAKLSFSRRFGSQPEIGAMANWLKDQQQYPKPQWQNNTAVRVHLQTSVARVEQPYMPLVQAAYHALTESILQQKDIVTVLEQQKHFQILCALREGAYGVSGINAAITEVVGKKTLWYVGRPVMVTHNDNDKKLYNGDVGLVLPISACGKFIDITSTQLHVCFLVEGGFRLVSLAQMPPHETCYAITIHKSQGSEYQHVAIVLPGKNSEGQFQLSVTRELVYTAITRAKEQVDIWCEEGELEYAANTNTVRMSRLQWMIDSTNHK